MNPGILDNLTTRPSQTSVNKLPFLTPIGILFDPSHGGGFQGGGLLDFFNLRGGAAFGPDQPFECCRKRQLSFPVSTISQWCAGRSSRAAVIFPVAEHRWPLRERQVGRADHRRALVEPAQQVEQELAAGPSEGQVSKLVQNDQVAPDELLREPSLPPVPGLSPEQGREQAHAGRGAGGQLPYIARRSLDHRPEQGGARLFRNHPGDHDPDARPAQDVQAARRRRGVDLAKMFPDAGR